MDNEQLQHLKKMRKAYQRRLRILELQKVKMEPHVPPHIIIDIEDTNEKLEKIDEEVLQQLLFQPFQESSQKYKQDVAPSQQVVEITFKGDFPPITDLLKNIIAGVIAAIVDVPASQIKIQSARRGSLIVILTMPVLAAEYLLVLDQIRDPYLTEIGVERVLVEGDLERRDTERTNLILAAQVEAEADRVRHIIEALKEAGVSITPDLVVKAIQASLDWQEIELPVISPPAKKEKK